jgi:hypothetical protein
VTALVDRQRLARVCGLFGSDHDGEALAAARQAEKIRKKVGLTWEELLVPFPRQRAADPPPEELTDWRWACHFFGASQVSVKLCSQNKCLRLPSPRAVVMA